MKENIKNLNVLISYWLLITTLLVALIIIIAGIFIVKKNDKLVRK